MRINLSQPYGESHLGKSLVFPLDSQHVFFCESEPCQSNLGEKGLTFLEFIIQEQTFRLSALVVTISALCSFVKLLSCYICW